MVNRRARAFLAENEGATMVEMTLVIVLLFLVTLGFVDFGYALYQWNQASKAVQVGARLAAVSNPVATGLAAKVAELNAEIAPGDPSKSYSVVCNGASPTCIGLGGLDVDAAALNRIVFGADGTCGPPFGTGARGMCDVFQRNPPLGTANVVVEYTYSGLGYAARPGGPVPTIRVQLQDLNFNFFFLAGLLGLGQMEIPPMTGTITGEDLSTTF
ncbi:TadE/TadG family type IV pilus assembly protein [Microbaculum marinisediminis]|uniref:Pilus assembly protein n=1 Tax=Microbaculum marinisediminis TaxID=2931392 RepID=A0AAW5R0N4_9HYPH|nr:TadE/TadG family type IV pilus assembly protein [Microbaculum sp. A6E488]MCT8972704.1 pilus assembly protein [Microbaculum sp. A6E488]